MNTDKHQSVRKALAEHTRTAHETLHHHQWIGCLTSPDLTPAQYFSVLSAYRQFYQKIESERARLDSFRQLNLIDAIEHLESDTASTSVHIPIPTCCDDIVLHNEESALGALYVLHGARFGAAILNKQVAATLPAAPRQFLGNATPLAQWRQLTDAIESRGIDQSAQNDMFKAADTTFQAFGKSVTQYCEAVSEL